MAVNQLQQWANLTLNYVTGMNKIGFGAILGNEGSTEIAAQSAPRRATGRGRRATRGKTTGGAQQNVAAVETAAAPQTQTRRKYTPRKSTQSAQSI